MLHNSFSSLKRSKSFSLFCFFLLSLCGPPEPHNKVDYLAGSIFLLTITRSVLLARIWWYVCILKSLRILCISFFRTDSELCIYHLIVWSNFNFLHNSLMLLFCASSSSSYHYYYYYYYYYYFNKPLWIFPSTPITAGITVTFITLLVLWKGLSLSLFFLLSLCGPPGLYNKVDYLASSIFLLTITRSVLLASIWWYVCISKSQRILCISFFRTDSELCIYHLIVWSNFNFLHNFL